MEIRGNGEREPMQLSITRGQVRAKIIENLIIAGVLLRSEVVRYDKLLDSYDNNTLLRVMIVSHQLKEAKGKIIT